MRTLLPILVFAAISTSAFAQPADSYSAKIDEIYPSGFFAGQPDVRQAYVNLLKERIAYKLEPATSVDKYPKLSDFPLMNKLNPAVVAPDPTQFDVNTFNPLVYNLSFFADREQVFRIDGTDYLLIVYPQVSRR